MAYIKKSLPTRIFQFLLFVAGFVVLINAGGCIYMVRSLKSNAMDMMRQVMAVQSGEDLSGHTYPISAQAFGIVAHAHLTVNGMTSAIGGTCVDGTLVKDGKFGFIFPMTMGPPQNIEVCTTK